jgi:citrate lyase subunit beta / citryl-CoA lyase
MLTRSTLLLQPSARLAAAAAVSEGYTNKEVVVRLNGIGTEWHGQDLEVICASRPNAVVLPKVESGAEIEDTCKAMDAMGVPKEVGIWAMIETPLGVLRAEEISRAGQVRAVHFDLDPEIPNSQFTALKVLNPERFAP